MKTFPMFLKMAGRRVVIIGGGEQAAQKTRLMLKTEAEIVVVAPNLECELQDLISEGRVARHEATAPDLFENTTIVFVATGCKGADAAWHARAKAEGMLVNVVDYPALCDAMTPSIVDRDPVVVAIGTEGTAPLLGRRIKTSIEETLHPRLGDFAILAGQLRKQVARYVPAPSRRAFWRWVFNDAPWRAFSSGQERTAANMIMDAIKTREMPQAGHLCIVHNATDPGMIPMVVVQRLQEADIIYADPKVPNDVLELARRDAERIRFSHRPDMQAHFASNTRIALNAACTKSVVCLFAVGTPNLDRALSTREVLIEKICCSIYEHPTGIQQMSSPLGLSR